MFLNSNKFNYYDVIISGGGLIGIITAISLNSNSISVAVIDKKNTIHTNLVDDNRVLAISQKSKKIMDNIGIWSSIKKKSEPIFDIFVLDENTPFSVHFDHKIVSEFPMGYVVSNSVMWNVINSNFLNKLNIYSPNFCKNITYSSKFLEVTLNDDRKLISSLLICAEGKDSKLVESFSIPIIKFSYNQSSIVFNIEHEIHHRNLAVEGFFSGGPIAVLPMKGGHISSVIWTDKSEISKMLMSISKEELIVEFKKRFGSYLGKIRLHGEKKLYPLKFSLAKKLYKNRFLIIGDSAHSIHPIAGQGFNLGIRDIESVVKHIVIAKNLGIDIGSRYLMNKISHERFLDNFTMALITDGLNRLFSNKKLCAKIFRNLGLILVENSTFIKKIFINEAMGYRKILSDSYL